MKKRAVLYTRVSTNKDEQKKSMVNQREFYEEYCERRGYELVDIYPEEGRTGTNSRRPEFKKLLYDGGVDFQENPRGSDIFYESNRKPLFDIVIVKDAARWSRNSNDGKIAIERLLAKGVNTIFENSGVSTFDSNWEMNLSLLFTMAQNESHNMGKRIKFSKQHSARRGRYAPSRVPYGYKRDEENSEKIIIDDGQSKVVKLIFERYLEVGSLIIARELNEMNITTQQGAKWTPDKITRIITNKIYTGTATLAKTTKLSVTDTKVRKTKKEDYIEIPNAVSPIISVKDYEKANEIKEMRINKNKKVGRKPARNDKYHDKLVCGKCGSSFVRHMGNGGKITYICQNRRKGLGCDVRGIAIKNLDRNLEEVELTTLRNGMGDSSYYSILNSKINDQKNRLDETRKEINLQIESIEDEIEKITDNYLQLPEGNKMRERLMKRAEEKDKEIEGLQKKLSKMNFETIEMLKEKVEAKKDMIETIFNRNVKSEEDKIKLLHYVEIGDYELKYIFAIPSFEEEVEAYNKLFNLDPITTSIPFTPLSSYFRRTHLEAREMWQAIDEQNEIQDDEYEATEEKTMSYLH